MNTTTLDPVVHPNFDRFTEDHFIFTRPRDNISILRRQFIETAKRIDPTHFLTFNFYRGYSMERAQVMMDDWYGRIHLRLFRSHPSNMLDEEAMAMFGLPEYTKQGHIHYHVAARIDAHRQDWFTKIAPLKWKAIVKSGDLHVNEFDGTEEGLDKATIYMTKSSSFGEWYIPKDYKGSAFARRKQAMRHGLPLIIDADGHNFHAALDTLQHPWAS